MNEQNFSISKSSKEKLLEKRAEKIPSNNLFREEVDKSLKTISLAREISVKNYLFALEVLRANIEDAENINANTH